MMDEVVFDIGCLLPELPPAAAGRAAGIAPLARGSRRGLAGDDSNAMPSTSGESQIQWFC